MVRIGSLYASFLNGDISNVFRFLTDVNLMSSRSSVIAAAATLLTLDENLTRESVDTKIKTFACGFDETVSVVVLLDQYSLNYNLCYMFMN